MTESGSLLLLKNKQSRSLEYLSAQRVAQQTGIGEMAADVLPTEKLQQVNQVVREGWRSIGHQRAQSRCRRCRHGKQWG